MQPLGLPLVIFVVVHLASAVRVRHLATPDSDGTNTPPMDDAIAQPAIITKKGLVVTMQGHTYKVKSIYQTMKEVRILSKAMREKLQQVIRDNDKKKGEKGGFLTNALFLKAAEDIFEVVPEQLMIMMGVFMIGAVWLDGKEKALNKPLSSDQLMTMVLRIALGSVWEENHWVDEKESVRELVQNLLNMKPLTKNYKLAPSQHAEFVGDMAAIVMKDMRTLKAEADDIKFQRRREQMHSLGEFMQALLSVSNPKEVLEGWQAPFKLPFYYLGAMINELGREAELWKSLGVQEPGAE